MKLTITSEAQRWFQEEVEGSLEKGIRFYGKIYGNTAVHNGFSVGMAVDTPENPLVEKTVGGIVYFIEETDDWFFNGYDLCVDYDGSKEEPSYVFTQNITYSD